VQHHRISSAELVLAQIALLIAIGLQLTARYIGSDTLPGSQDLIIITELGLAVLMAFTINMHKAHDLGIHHLLAVILLAVISAANVSSLIYVLGLLINGQGVIGGQKLLASALAIFLTNIIVFALWYWEVDSPGLTRTHWSKYNRDFQFTQQDLAREHPGWQPQFGDYLYLSITNATNFAPADVRPLTLQAKALMASQSLVAVFTLALVIARSVSILH
jgi:uncharacterized membrane protein